MIMFAPYATTGLEYRKFFSCPAQLLHLAHEYYENRELKVSDPLIRDDSGKNRFLWFAKWNLATYYSHAPADLTLTTTSLTGPTTGSLTDLTGPAPSTWATIEAKLKLKAIDSTLPFGQQLGWLVFNMYNSVIMRVDIDINNKAIQPYELEIYGISAEDVLLREFSYTTL